MTIDHHRTDELFPLFARLHDGDVTVDELRDIEHRVSNDPQVCELYVAYTLQVAQFTWDNSVHEDFRPSITGDNLRSSKADIAVRGGFGGFPSQPSRVWLANPRFWVAVSLLMAVFLSGLYFLVGQGWRPVRMAAQDQREQEHSSQQIAALVTGAVNCQWAKESPVLEVGDRAVIGKRYELADGLVRLVFGHQAGCLLEGPIVFRVVSADVVRIERGRLAAEVPASAKGFAVRTPWANVIDLGTEFGVEVEEGGPLAIHVFQGKVQMEPVVEGPSAMTIAAGQSVQLFSRGTDITVAQGEAQPMVFRRHFPIAAGGGHVESRFDESTEGWTVTVDGHSPVAHKVEEGPHGGYLETYDEREETDKRRVKQMGSQGGGFYYSFVAPSEYRGDYGTAYGKKLAFDLRIRGGSGDPTTKYCELHGADMTLAFPVKGPLNNDTWAHFEIPLRDGPKWVRLDLPGRPAAKPGALKAVLSDLRRLVIPGEFYSDEEWTAFDNVILGAEAKP